MEEDIWDIGKITNHDRTEMEKVADEIYTIKEEKIIDQLILKERELPSK